jgi:hypothetical protein
MGGFETNIVPAICFSLYFDFHNKYGIIPERCLSLQMNGEKQSKIQKDVFQG